MIKILIKLLIAYLPELLELSKSRVRGDTERVTLLAGKLASFYSSDVVEKSLIEEIKQLVKDILQEGVK